MENKFLFIHIPKTAGQYITNCLVHPNNLTVYTAHHNSMLSTNFVKKNCNYRWFDYEGSYQSLRDEKIVAETGAENKEVISPFRRSYQVRCYGKLIFYPFDKRSCILSLETGTL